MAYCRWSSNNWDCDLYCYADVSGGYTTHVAGNRITGDIPKLPELTEGNIKSGEWHKAYDEQQKFLDSAKREDIGLPEDGKTFNDSDLQSFLECVIWLKSLGYHVPLFVIEEIEEEIRQSDEQD